MSMQTAVALAFSACGGGNEVPSDGEEGSLNDSSQSVDSSSGGQTSVTFEGEGTDASGGTFDGAEEVDPCPEITGTEGVVGPGCVQLGRLRVEDLEILPGTTVKVHMDGFLAVEGEFIAIGTELEPIIFESAEEVPLPGDWDCISFEGGADSEMSHLTVRHAGDGCQNTPLETPTALLLAESPRTFSHILIEESAGDGLQLLHDAYNIRTFEGLSLRNIEGRSVVAEPVAVEGLGGPISLDEDDRSVVIDAHPIFDIDQNTTWKNLGVPYEVQGILDLDRPLTIEAGTVLLMSERVSVGRPRPREGRFGYGWLPSCTCRSARWRSPQAVFAIG